MSRKKNHVCMPTCTCTHYHTHTHTLPPTHARAPDSSSHIHASVTPTHQSHTRFPITAGVALSRLAPMTPSLLPVYLLRPRSESRDPRHTGKAGHLPISLHALCQATAGSRHSPLWIQRLGSRDWDSETVWEPLTVLHRSMTFHPTFGEHSF